MKLLRFALLPFPGRLLLLQSLIAPFQLLTIHSVFDADSDFLVVEWGGEGYDKILHDLPSFLFMLAASF